MIFCFSFKLIVTEFNRFSFLVTFNIISIELNVEILLVVEYLNVRVQHLQMIPGLLYY